MPNTNLCGPKESCFENGKCWGHLENVMCKHLGEGPNNQFFCNKIQKYVKHTNVYTTSPHTIWKKKVKPEDLTGARVVGITLTTPGGKEGPIHKITINEKGRVTHQENTPEWGETFLTFPPAFKDLNDIAEWSFNLLKDCYGCGDVIEQRVCVLELYTHEEISKALDKEMFEDIKQDINERMGVITDSRQPTGDDIRIAWLVSKVEDLNKEVDSLNKIVKDQCLAQQNRFKDGGKLTLDMPTWMR